MNNYSGFIFLLLLLSACVLSETDKNKSGDKEEILQVHEDYVSGWLAMDEEKVMRLMEDDAIIQPNRLQPIQGKENIRNFWFPADSSITTIHQFETEILHLELMDSIALTTHSSLLNFDYEKPGLNMGMIQKSFNTTIYRRQKDDSWKIWRSMWTDYYSESK